MGDIHFYTIKDEEGLLSELAEKATEEDEVTKKKEEPAVTEIEEALSADKIEYMDPLVAGARSEQERRKESYLRQVAYDIFIHRVANHNGKPNVDMVKQAIKGAQIWVDTVESELELLRGQENE